MIEKYDRFYGEMQLDRYDLLLLKLECLRKTDRIDEAKKLEEYTSSLAEKFFPFSFVGGLVPLRPPLIAYRCGIL